MARDTRATITRARVHRSSYFEELEKPRRNRAENIFTLNFILSLIGWVKWDASGTLAVHGSQGLQETFFEE